MDRRNQWGDHGGDGLGAARGMVFAAGAIMLAAMVGAILWLAWDIIRPHLADAASATVDYLDTGPGCPGADYGWLGRCAEAPK